MSNVATLQTAPPFTSANASEMGKRSAEARKAKIRAQMLNNARPPIEPEINRVVKAMSKLPVTSDDYLRLSGILERLWNKAFPTQAAVRSKPTRATLAVPEPSVEPVQPQEQVKPDEPMAS